MNSYLKVLVLTHELSDAASWDLGKYQEYFWPVKPQLLFGRPAAMYPKCPEEHAVWYGWRDLGASKIRIASPTQQ